jgi:hypothetical protein
MENDWVKIFSTISPMEAEIVKTMLEDNEIEIVEMNKLDSSYQSFGSIELYCHKDFMMKALTILKKNRP